MIRLEGSTIAGDLGYRVAAARVVAIWTGPGVLTEPELGRLRTNLPGVDFFDRLCEMLDAFPGLGGYSKG